MRLLNEKSLEREKHSYGVERAVVREGHSTLLHECYFRGRGKGMSANKFQRDGMQSVGDGARRGWRESAKKSRRAAFLLHEQGVYPSARRVFNVLNDTHVLRTKERHEAWRQALEELSYPTDTFKRYD